MLPRLLLLLLPCVVSAGELRTEYGGHTKLALTGQHWPGDSLVRDAIGSDSIDSQGDLRLNLELRKDGWSFDANCQFAILNGDSLALTARLPPGNELFASGLPNDERRLMNLTDVVDKGSRHAILHRLDRLWVGYANDTTVVRFGRQALSWGNALFYAPMDLVNPFDPAAIDKEYKAGDDMLYVQYLLETGADIQGAYVARRSLLTGDVDEGKSTAALKYHGFVGDGELDLLVARHYGDTVVGIGANRGIGGAQWSADVVVTNTDIDTYVQLSTSLAYSWNRLGKNMSGALEYHFNGFGQHGGRYDPVSLSRSPDLLLKLSRGDTFTLGRHYVAGSVTIEMTPLWSVSPTLLGNLEDPSALLQLVTNYSLGDNMTLLGSLNLPLGSRGTEFGGIETGIAGRYLASGPGVFAQFAWYF